MTDKELLEFYLASERGDAGRWSSSSGSLELKAGIRRSLTMQIQPRLGWLALNVGIGRGEWDDFLGYWLEARGSVVSVDRDVATCEMLKYRQSRAQHPNPSIVLACDMTQVALAPEVFDVVTIVGTTLAESQASESLITQAMTTLRPGGVAFLATLSLDGRRLDAAELTKMTTATRCEWRNLPAPFDRSVRDTVVLAVTVGKRLA